MKLALKSIFVVLSVAVLVALATEIPSSLVPATFKSDISIEKHRTNLELSELDEEEEEVSNSSTVPENSAPSPHPRIKIVRYTVAPGDTLSKIWSNRGGDAQGGVAAAQALTKVSKTAHQLQKGDRLSLLVDNKNVILGLRKRINDGKIVTVKRNESGVFTTQISDQTLVESERRVTGTIYTSFSDSARSAELPYEVMDELVDLIGNRLDFRKDLQVGDTFTVIYSDKRTKRGKLIENGSIKAASIENNGNLLVAIRYDDGKGNVRYYDENGKSQTSGFLRYPVQFSRISSVFAKSRLHPVLKVARPHNGVDFAASTGTPVRTVADGVVIASEYKKCTGNMVRIQHDERYSTEYFHLSRITPGIKKGARVSRGEVIGAVGMTGLATAPHLHFGFFDKGKYIDPLSNKLPLAPTGKDLAPPSYIMATLQTLRGAHDSIRVARDVVRSDSHA